MKKQIAIFSFSLLILSFFACDMEIPSKIEIKGNPDIRFAAVFDIGSELSNIFGDAFNNNDKLKVINCTNTPVKTFIIYSKVLEDDLNVDLSGISNSEINLPEIQLINNEITIPSIDLGQFLNGFSFKDYKANLYISGSEIADILTVELDIDGNKTSKKGRNNSNLGSTDNYSGAALPDGIDITDYISFDGSEIEISTNVYIAAGNYYISEEINNSPKNVKIEIAIWLPLTLAADNDGAGFSFPEDLFDQQQDLFGRASAADANSISDFIQSIGIEIKLNGANPFSGADLVVTNKVGDIEIITPISSNVLKFEVNEDTMKKINSSWPFAPKFKMEFKQGSVLSIPKELKTSEVALKVKLNYKIDLEG